MEYESNSTICSVTGVYFYVDAKLYF